MINDWGIWLSGQTQPQTGLDLANKGLPYILMVSDVNTCSNKFFIDEVSVTCLPDEANYQKSDRHMIA